MKRVIVSARGQVTIPKAIRDRLGIRPGDEIELIEEGERPVLRKLRRQDPLDRVYGILARGLSTDDIIEELRGPVDHT